MRVLGGRYVRLLLLEGVAAFHAGDLAAARAHLQVGQGKRCPWLWRSLPLGGGQTHRHLHMNIYALMWRGATSQAWPLCVQDAQGKWRLLQVDDSALAELIEMGFRPALVSASCSGCRLCLCSGFPAVALVLKPFGAEELDLTPSPWYPTQTVPIAGHPRAALLQRQLGCGCGICSGGARAAGSPPRTAAQGRRSAQGAEDVRTQPPWPCLWQPSPGLWAHPVCAFSPATSRCCLTAQGVVGTITSSCKDLDSWEMQ